MLPAPTPLPATPRLLYGAVSIHAADTAAAHHSPFKGDTSMATMTDSRRKKIQARQRKRENAEKRAAKAAKRERNAKKS